jgi:quercetin dioxygenase-like cupin family protein
VIHGHGKTGEQLSDPQSHKDDYELCWVISGKVRIELPNEKHELGPGDALQFDAVLHHSYEVLENCELIIVHQAKAKRF